MSTGISRIRTRRLTRARSLKQLEAAVRSSTTTDVVLQRLANASQLALVALAVFGYFYTVLPVYQKSLLDEDIAKKTLELRAMEGRIAQAEALLESREAEVSVLTKRMNELKTAGDLARQGLGRAQAEVGVLRGAVETRYVQLLPRLLRDFQSLALSQCGPRRTAGPEGFADCMEREVFSSSSLNGFESADLARLKRLVHQRSGAIDKALTDFDSGIARRKRDVDEKVREAQARCEQQKGGEDYKDRVKKITIDYQCDSDAARASSDRLKIQLDEMLSGGKVISTHLADIVRDFLSDR